MGRTTDATELLVAMHRPAGSLPPTRDARRLVVAMTPCHAEAICPVWPARSDLHGRTSLWRSHPPGSFRSATRHIGRTLTRPAWHQGRKATKVSDASEFQNRINQLRSELQGKVSEFQSRMSEVQSKLSELPSKMGAHAEERVASIFEDIDPEASPHAYSVKAAGNTVLDLIDGLVHAVAAIEKDLAAREGGG
jgi:hypothetical protein